jgi:photosystem II stability/assembly factor-like uncharacterized protein
VPIFGGTRPYSGSAIRSLLLIALLFGFVSQAVGQKHLFVALNNSKGYVVGAKLQQSGMFRFEEDTSWTHIGWNHPFIGGIAFATNSSGTIHTAAGNGAMRSFDGGQTWKITTGWEVTEAQHIALDRGDRERIYLATSYGIWRSRDGGDSWRQVFDDYTQAVQADIFTARRVVAATEGGLYLSENGGDTWRPIGPETPMMDVDQSDSHPLEWIAGSRLDGVFRSKDGGANWTRVLEPDAEVTAVSIDPVSLRRQVATTWGQGVFVSEDGGVTWTSRTDGLPTEYLIEAIFDANRTGRIWVATKEQGVFYSDDLGSTWTYAGMTGTMVFDMVFAE